MAAKLVLLAFIAAPIAAGLWQEWQRWREGAWLERRHHRIMRGYRRQWWWE